MRIGGWEWIIVLVVVLLIFGVGRLSQLGKDLGEGIREFRKGIAGDEGESEYADPHRQFAERHGKTSLSDHQANPDPTIVHGQNRVPLAR